ncbi:MFS transporter [Streptomyces sp. NPDC004237]|uniref:MFS transporter n=1 Tax=Streptomyces sp. NPDC004237 TaxID=3154455 RepID=UPI0033AB4631
MSGSEDSPASSPLGRNKDFNRLLAGSVISNLGSRSTAIAYPLLGLALTGSPEWAGIIGFCSLLPSLLFCLPAGPHVERRDPRIIMLVCEAVRLLAVAIIAVSLITSTCRIYLLAIMAFIEGSFAVFYPIAEAKLIRRVVSTEQTSAALARIQGRNSVAQLLGRPLGGVLFGLGRAIPFLVDMCSFFASLIMVGLIRIKKIEPGSRLDGPPISYGIRSGLKCFRGEPFLSSATLLVSAGNLIYQAEFIIYLANAKADGVHPSIIGLAYGCAGIGGVLGAASAKSIFDWLGFRVVLVCQWVCMIAVSILTISNTSATFGVAITIFVVAGVISNVGLQTYVFRRIPNDLMAHVVSIELSIGYAGTAAGPLVGGFIYSQLGSRTSCVLLAVLSALLTLTAMNTKPLRAPPPVAVSHPETVTERKGGAVPPI